MLQQIIGSSVIHLDETNSTNQFTIQFLKENRPAEGTVFIADNQTQGRGMDTNAWESEPGKNLTFSILLYPDFLPVERQFSLNQAIALGLSEFVRKKVIPGTVTVKWPNDIYINDKKVCGTLIQNSIIGQAFDYVVVGIGLNVNQVHFKNLVPNPVSLQNTTGLLYDLRKLLTELCTLLDIRYQQLKSGGSGSINTHYLSNLYRYNQWYRYSINGSEHEARITGISEYGQLLLENREGRCWVCDVKDVKYL